MILFDGAPLQAVSIVLEGTEIFFIATRGQSLIGRVTEGEEFVDVFSHRVKVLTISSTILNIVEYKVSETIDQREFFIEKRLQ